MAISASAGVLFNLGGRAGGRVFAPLSGCRRGCGPPGRTLGVLLVVCCLLATPAFLSAYGSSITPRQLNDEGDYFACVDLMKAGDWGRAAVLLAGLLSRQDDGPRRNAARFMLGVAYLEAGRLTEAQAPLTAALQDFPDLGDICLYYLYRLRLAEEDYTGALAALNSIGQNYPASPLNRNLPVDVVNCLLAGGRCREAQLILSNLLQAEPDHPQTAELTLLSGKALEECGEKKQAVEIYSRIVHEHRFGAETFEAKKRFDELYYSKVEMLQSPLWLDESRDWAMRLAQAAQYEQAVKVRSAIVDFLRRNSYQQEELLVAGKQLAYARYQARDYPGAIAAYDNLLAAGDLLDRRELLYWKARALARLGLEDQALPILTTLSTGPTQQNLTRQSRYHRGLLFFETGKYLLAEQVFSAYLEEYPNDQSTRNVRWYRAWCLLRTGQTDRAIDDLVKLKPAAKGDDLQRIRYWAARAHLLSGRGDTAKNILGEIYQKWPTTYYGLASYRTLVSLGLSPTPPKQLVTPDRSGLPPLPRLDPATLSGKPYYPALDRAIRLLEMGLVGDAARELSLVYQDLDSDPRVRAEMARLLGQTGSIHRSLRLTFGLKKYLTDYRTGPGLDPSRLLFPLAYRESVQRQAADTGLSPWLIWSVMRQESRFDPGVESSVGARGLMQIMPQTGRRLAADLGDPDFEVFRLAEPELNIRYGASYLKWLWDRYDGRAALAVAAYNAGENAVDRWIRKLGDDPEEFFIEEIPYSETRRYVREVLLNITMYELIYEGAAD